MLLSHDHCNFQLARLRLCHEYVLCKATLVNSWEGIWLRNAIGTG